MVVLASPVLHEYVPPPLAVSVVLAPVQIARVAGEIDAIGFGFIVTERDADAEHDPPSVTVTE